MATFVIELSISNAFPTSHALQDAARDVMRSAAHNIKADNTSTYGSMAPLVSQLYDRVRSEAASVLRCWELFLDFGGTIPYTGLTEEHVKAINERIHKAQRQTVEKAANGEKG